MSSPARRPLRAVTRYRWVVGAGLVLAALLVTVIALSSRSGTGDGSPAAASSSASATVTAVPEDGGVTAAPAMPDATGPTGDADALPVALPAVPLDAPASADDGMRAEIVAIEAIDGNGSGVGNVSGPALKVTLRLDNATTDPVALDYVSVSLTHGTDQTPAPRLDDSSAAPFTGTLEPGATAQGVYVFTVPADDRELVTVSVGYRAGLPYLAFSGAAP